MSGIPRPVAVLAAKEDDCFHTNSLRRRRPCGPEISRLGARCRAVVESCPGGAFAEPRKASQRAHGLAAHEARTPFGARAFPRHAKRTSAGEWSRLSVLGWNKNVAMSSGETLHLRGPRKPRDAGRICPKTSFRSWVIFISRIGDLRSLGGLSVPMWQRSAVTGIEDEFEQSSLYLHSLFTLQVGASRSAVNPANRQ